MKSLGQPAIHPPVHKAPCWRARTFGGVIMAVSYGDLFISYSKSAPLDVDYKSLFWQIGERRMGGGGA